MTTDENPSSRRPMAGVRILELGSNVAGPLASMLLAEQGAQVIKIEPAAGDAVRYVGTLKENTSALFANVSRGKRSIVLDLRSPEGQEIARELAMKSDVLLHNFRPGVMERLNLGSEALREANPCLVYVAVSGFGTDGPLAGQPVYDSIMQALTGYTDIQGAGGTREYVKGIVCDKVTAYTACQAISAALFARAYTGEGQHIDVSMLEASLHFLWPDGMMNDTLLADDVVPLTHIKDAYQKFPTKDGEISFVALSDEQWRAVFELIGRPEMIDDPRYGDLVRRYENIRSLFETVQKELVRVPTDEAVRFLRSRDIGCSALQSVEAAVSDPQVAALGAIQEREHPVLGPIRLSMPPVRFAGEQSAPASDAPTIGQHTREVLGELGLDDDRIDRLAAEGKVTLGSTDPSRI